MKELSIEEKAQRYDEILKVASTAHKVSSNTTEIRVYEELFPGLKESEDEKIRKSIIKYFKRFLVESSKQEFNDFINKEFKEYINWLEKQGKPQIRTNINIESSWSEEDSMFIKILRTMIAAYAKDDEDRKKLVRWLDIHCNAYPIPNKLYLSWKPSDEQMADLWNMVCECRPAEQQLLQDIYYGLKTLRGE